MTSAGENGEGLAIPAGSKRAPSEERCFRQISPKFVDVNDVLNDQAFRLRPDDKGLFSISLESKTTAAAAHLLHTTPVVQGGKGLPAVGTWAVTTQECHTVAQLDVYEDPTTTPFIDPAHGSIDMRSVAHNKDARKAKQKQLMDLAQARGPVFKP